MATAKLAVQDKQERIMAEIAGIMPAKVAFSPDGSSIAITYSEPIKTVEGHTPLGSVTVVQRGSIKMVKRLEALLKRYGYVYSTSSVTVDNGLLRGGWAGIWTVTDSFKKA